MFDMSLALASVGYVRGLVVEIVLFACGLNFLRLECSPATAVLSCPVRIILVPLTITRLNFFFVFFVTFSTILRKLLLVILVISLI